MDNEDQWASVKSAERPSDLAVSATRLAEAILGEARDPVIDLRALSLREWAVEFLWKLRAAELSFKVTFCLTLL